MIDFSNTETAFKMKTKIDLLQSRLLFSTLSSPMVVRVLKSFTLAALALRLPIKGIVKATVFRQFCGGESVEECTQQIDRLAAGNVGAILDYSVEGKAQEEDFNRTLATTIETLQYAKVNENVPFGVFKPTGLGRIDIYEKISQEKPLGGEEQLAWNQTLDRWKKIIEKAAELEVPVMVDAEESWIQPAVDDLVIQYMNQYNRKIPIVYNTAQLYRHDRFAQLEKALETAKQKGYIYAVKIVRGAYMEKERIRAKTMGYTSPIQPNKVATDHDYNEALKLILKNIQHMAVVIGTHNEDSVQLAATLLEDANLPLNHPRVHVAQLFGMSDHISFNASNAGLNTAKYLPFGPVRDVLPYLFRRAEENTSVEGQTGRELKLIQEELARRNA